MQQGVAEVCTRLFVELSGVERGLRFPQGVELLRDHRAFHIQVIAFVDTFFALLGEVGRFAVSGTYTLTCDAFWALLHAVLPEPFANGTATRSLNLRAQSADGLLERATVVVLAISLAVALEAPALV